MKRAAPEDFAPDNGGPLFALKHARRDDPATSKVAAVRAESLASVHCRKIEAALSALPNGGTAHEIAAALKGELTDVQVARRMSDLREKGRVEATDEIRPTPTNRPATVWRIT